MVLVVAGCGDPAGIVMASSDMQEPLGLESEPWAGLCPGPFLRLGVWELAMRHSLCIGPRGRRKQLSSRGDQVVHNSRAPKTCTVWERPGLAQL